MPTYTAIQARNAAPVAGHGFGGDAKVAVGSLEMAVAVAATDSLRFCKVPAGAVVYGGWLMGDDIDTNVTETFDMDIGWLATATEVADPDGFGNFGIIQGDALQEYKPVAGILLPLQGVLLADGPKLFTAEATIAGVVNTGAATGGTGTLTVCVNYFVNPNWAKTPSASAGVS